MLQQPEITGHFGGRLRDAAEGLQHHAVGLAGIGLTGHREGLLNTQLGGNPPVELTDLVVIPTE